MSVQFSSLKGHKSAVNSVLASSSGEHAVTTSEDNTCRVWDLSMQRTIQCFCGFEDEPQSACFASNDQSIVGVCVGKGVAFFDRRSGAVVSKTPTKYVSSFKDDASACCCNSDGTCLSVCDDAGRVHVIGMQGYKLTSFQRSQSHTNLASSVAWHPNDQGKVLSAAMDCTVAMWDVNRKNKCREWKVAQCDFDTGSAGPGTLINPPMVHDLSVLSETHAVAALGNGFLCVLDLEDSEKMTAQNTPTFALSCVDCFQHQSRGKMVISGGQSDRIDIWEPTASEDSEGSIGLTSVAAFGVRCGAAVNSVSVLPNTACIGLVAGTAPTVDVVNFAALL